MTDNWRDASSLECRDYLNLIAGFLLGNLWVMVWFYYGVSIGNLTGG